MSYSLRAGSERNQFRSDPARKLSANLYDIYRCCVYSEKFLMMDRGTVWNMLEFYSKNKFEKLEHIVGFIIRITNKGLRVVFLINIRFSIHSRLWREKKSLKLWYATHLGNAWSLVIYLMHLFIVRRRIIFVSSITLQTTEVTRCNIKNCIETDVTFSYFLLIPS